MAVAVAVAVSGGGAVAVAVPVAGFTKRLCNRIQKDFLIGVNITSSVLRHPGAEQHSKAMKF